MRRQPLAPVILRSVDKTNKSRVYVRETGELLGEVYFEPDGKVWRWRRTGQRKWRTLTRGQKREDAVAEVVADRFDNN